MWAKTGFRLLTIILSACSFQQKVYPELVAQLFGHVGKSGRRAVKPDANDIL